MKHLQIITFCLFLAIGASAQNFPDSTIVLLQQEIKALKSADKQLDSELANQKKQLQTFSENVSAELETNKANIQVIGDSLGVKIVASEQNIQTKIANVTESVGKKSLFVGISGIVLLLLSVALFFWLYRRQKSNRADIIGQLEKTKSSIDERLVAEFAKNTEALQSLVVTWRATSLPVNGAQSTNTPDHSLALKLADEITLIERNISLMDTNTKGLKQLNRSIGKLKDNLAANGYEIPELLGKPYNEGMKAIITNTIQDENLEKGVELITKIIKPQVNYKDVMIQAAQIEVSVG
jgi:FtsZ-binding cell division protein ZapB